MQHSALRRTRVKAMLNRMVHSCRTDTESGASPPGAPG